MNTLVFTEGYEYSCVYWRIWILLCLLKDINTLVFTEGYEYAFVHWMTWKLSPTQKENGSILLFQSGVNVLMNGNYFYVLVIQTWRKFSHTSLIFKCDLYKKNTFPTTFLTFRVKNTTFANIYPCSTFLFVGRNISLGRTDDWWMNEGQTQTILPAKRNYFTISHIPNKFSRNSAK